MRTLILVMLLGGVSTPVYSAQDQRPRLGVGFLLGEPTGLSMELELNRTHSLDAVVSYSLVQGRLHLHSDYLVRVHKHRHTHELGSIVPYFGLGARLALGEDKEDGLSVRIPVGAINFSLKRRLGVFFELAPGISVLPDTDFVMGAALGARYYF